MSYILLVEDNQANADMVIRILNVAGYTVKHCINGLESARIARTDPPALILLDFNLPDIDGQALILLLRKQMTHDLPIVALTARVSDVDKKIAKRFGCAGFIGKPFTSEELLDVVQKLYKTRTPETPE
jgi:CheY-like chemotaxis protein